MSSAPDARATSVHPDASVVNVPVGETKAAAAATKDAGEKDKVEEKKEEEQSSVSVSELFKFADTTDRVLMGVGFFASFVNGAGMPAFSEVFGQMVGKLVKPGVRVDDEMRDLSAILVYIGLVVFGLSWIQVATFSIAAERQSRRIRERYFEATLRQEVAFHDSEKPGGLAARLFGDITVIRNGINDKIGTGVMNFAMFLFGFGFGFYRSWQLTLVMFGTMPLIAGAGAWFASILEESTKNARTGYSRAGDISDEVMSNIRTVQAFGSEERELARFTEALDEAAGHGTKKEFMTVAGVGVTYGVMFSSYALAFWFASYLVERNLSTVADITSTFFAVLMGSFGIGLTFPSIGALAEARGAASKVYGVIDRVSKIDPFCEGKTIPDLKGKIEFTDLVFSYPTRLDEKLFTGVTVTVEAGTQVAFSGASGCGKSSFISLVQRMYDPIAGSVLIDGVDLKELNLDWWRSQLGVVSQEPHLFTGTIKDNILVGKEDATMNDIVEACKKANIHDTIMTLPDKYDTNVGTLGSQLSGGQKQRLAIARALIRKPRLLILDEATSALDSASEREVQAAIDKLMHNVSGERLTVLVIAHRLSTIRNVDKIFFVEHDGIEGSRIAESGTFDELIAKNGLFAQMASRQSKSLSTLADREDDAAASPGSAQVKDPSFEAADFEGAKLSATAFGAGEKKPDEVDPLKVAVEQELETVDAGMGRVFNLMPSKWPLALGLLGSVLSGGVYPFYSVVLARVLEIIGANTPEGIRAEIPLWSGMFIVVAGAAAIGWLLQGFYGYVGEQLTVILRRDAFRAILRQDMSFFDMPGRDPGSMQALLSGDCECVHQLWGPSIGTKIQMLCNLGAGIAISFVYSWKLALITLSTAPVMVATGAVQQMMIAGFGSMSGEQTAVVVTESLQNIRTVTSFNVHRRQIRLYSASLVENEASGIKLAIGAGAIFGLSQFSFYGVFALAFWYGGKLVQAGELKFFDVMVSSMAILMGAMGAGEAGGWAAKLSDSAKAAQRVFALLDRKPKIDINDGGDKDIGECNVGFEGVKFVYPSRPAAPVLKGFSMDMPSGRSRGLIGATGSGKSSVLQLLLRFYAPGEGTITIDSKDISSIDLRTWRSRTAAVLQEPSLFSGSVRDNIKYVNADATDAEVEKFAKLASIHDEIVAMEHGYDTQVGYKGRNLSGGQKQRVALARALLRKPTVLLLDEATSALDNATEARVQDGIATAVREHKMSVVSIAHRLTTIRHSDRILLLDSGVILESGTHDELIAKNGEYKRRWDTFNANAKQ